MIKQYFACTESQMKQLLKEIIHSSSCRTYYLCLSCILIITNNPPDQRQVSRAESISSMKKLTWRVYQTWYKEFHKTLPPNGTVKIVYIIDEASKNMIESQTPPWKTFSKNREHSWPYYYYNFCVIFRRYEAFHIYVHPQNQKNIR